MSFPDTTSLLRYLYADLSRMSEVAADNIKLHRADRDLTSPPTPPICGVDAVQAYEEALIAATGGSLVMEVQSITANDHYGAVLGVLRAEATAKTEELAVHFCGVWRFEGGKPVEHWENASDVQAFARYLERARG